MKEERKEKQYGVIAFLPLFVFLALYIGSGIIFNLLGVEGAFKKFPRHVALLIGIVVAMLMNRGMKLDKKIEKTYSYRINGNDSTLNSEIENKFSQEIKNNSFRYSSASPDIRLEINVDMVYFYPEDVDMKSFPKQYTESYKDSSGKDNTNIVSYSENVFKKTTSMGVRLNYRLISNLTGEIIFNGSKNFDKKYEEKWKTYFIISDKIFNRDRLPKDENEKSVPSKKKIIEDITKEILNTIDADFHKLL